MPLLRVLFEHPSRSMILGVAITVLTLTALSFSGCGGGGAGPGGVAGLIPSRAASLQINTEFFESVSAMATRTRLASTSQFKTFPGSPTPPPPFIRQVRFTVGIPGDPSAVVRTFPISAGASLDFTINGLQSGSNILFTAEAIDEFGKIHFRDGQLLTLIPGGITQINAPFFPLQAVDPTTFSGGLVDTDLLLTQGTYNITQSINVTSDVAMIVEKGTTLSMSAGTGITVQGIMRSEGRPAEPITIAGGSFAGIQFNQSRFGTPAIRSALIFTRIAGAGGTAVQITDSDCALVNDTFDNCQTGVSINTTSSCVVQRCAFLGLNGSGSAIQVTDCDDVLLDDNILVGSNIVNSIGIQLVRSPVTIVHNKVGLFDFGVDCTDSGAQISANWIRGIGKVGVSSSQTGGAITVVPLEPRIVGNNITDCANAAVDGGTSGGAILGSAAGAGGNFIARRGSVVNVQSALATPFLTGEPDGTLGTPTLPTTLTAPSPYVNNVDVIFASAPAPIPGATSSNEVHGIGFDVPPVYFEPPLVVGAPGVKAIDAGDVNGDLRPDLVMAVDPGGGATSQARVQLTTIGGDLDFPSLVTGTGHVPSSIVAADLNQDGLCDFVISNSNPPTPTAGPDALTVFQSNGANPPTVAQSLAAGPFATGVIVVDLRDTSRRDILFADSGGTTVSMFLDQGAGTYGPRTDLAVPRITPVALTTADFNGDGKLDLAVACKQPGPSNNVFVYLATAPGVFAGPSFRMSVAGPPTALVADDFNKDGLKDLAVLDAGPINQIAIFLNSPTGFKSTPDITIPLPAVATAMKGFDINEDGIPDLIVTCAGTSNTLNVLLGLGNGNFLLQSIPGFNGPDSIALGDFDLDGHTDIAVHNGGVPPGPNAQTVMILLQL